MKITKTYEVNERKIMNEGTPWKGFIHPKSFISMMVKIIGYGPKNNLSIISFDKTFS